MKKTFYYLLLSLSFFRFASFGQMSPGTKAKFNVVFIYNFARYFEWKNIDELKEFKIGLLGANEMEIAEFKKMAEVKKVGERPIKIIIYNTILEVTEVEVLYVNCSKVPDYKINNSVKNMLIVTENNPDLNNTMIAFFEDNNKKKFAINEVNIARSGLVMSPNLIPLASTSIKGNDKKADEASAKDWRNVFDKLSELTKGDKKEITLSKEEALTVQNKITEQVKDIAEKQVQLSLQKQEIAAHQKDLLSQKAKIDEQMLSITNQEEKLRLQEKKLQLTIQENALQEHDLEISKKEVALQESKIKDQMTILADQKKDIEEQNVKLLSQLDLINSQKLILYLSGLIVLIIAIALILLFKSFQNKKKANILLAAQKTEIEIQKTLVDEKQKEILDSIHYAKRIQTALMPTEKYLERNLNELTKTD